MAVQTLSLIAVGASIVPCFMAGCSGKGDGDQAYLAAQVRTKAHEPRDWIIEYNIAFTQDSVVRLDRVWKAHGQRRDSAALPSPEWVSGYRESNLQFGRFQPYEDFFSRKITRVRLEDDVLESSRLVRNGRFVVFSKKYRLGWLSASTLEVTYSYYWPEARLAWFMRKSDQGDGDLCFRVYDGVRREDPGFGDRLVTSEEEMAGLVRRVIRESPTLLLAVPQLSRWSTEAGEGH